MLVSAASTEDAFRAVVATLGFAGSIASVLDSAAAVMDVGALVAGTMSAAVVDSTTVVVLTIVSDSTTVLDSTAAVAAAVVGSMTAVDSTTVVESIEVAGLSTAVVA